MKKNDVLIGECIDYTYDGLGIVKSHDFIFFIRQVLKGEKIEFVITKFKKNYGYGKCLKILQESRNRMVPPCAYFGKCGGCQIQHMSYDEQLNFKRNIVSNNMKNIAHMDIEVKPVIEAKDICAYRNKAQFPVSIDEGKVEVGFYRIHSNDIIDMSTCLIQSNEINEVMNAIKVILKKMQLPNIFRHLLIKHAFATHEIMVVLIVNENHILIKEMADQLIKQFSSIKSIILNINTRNDNVILGKEEIILFGENKIIDNLDGLSFTISSKSFYQVNPVQMKTLYQTTLEMADIDENDTVIDLYCGVGTISLFLARKAKKVIGIEIVAAAIEDAKKNAEINHISNVEFICSDAAKYASYLVDKKQSAEIVVVDPPRKGCDENTLLSVNKMNPKKIIYISCNPATLARDLAFMKKLGYICEFVQPVDMFPNTYHIESVVRLSRVK